MSLPGQHYALDGSLVSIQGVLLDPSIPWSGSIRCLANDEAFGFQTGPRGTAQLAMLPHGRAFAFSEEYGFQGGQLRVGSLASPLAVGDEGYLLERVWVAAWEGTQYSLFTFRRTGETGHARVIMDFFRLVSIIETPLGIRLRPSADDTVQLLEPEVKHEIPRLGLVEIRPTSPAQLATLPDWPGTAVAGGDLYETHAHVGDRSESVFVLVGSSAVSVIQPLDNEPIDTPERLRTLESLRVSWESGNES